MDPASMTLNYEEMEVLADMVEEWMDKDRHGELKREWDYEDWQIEAVSTMYAKIVDWRGY